MNTCCASSYAASVAERECTAPEAQRPPCGATCAPPAATGTPAASGSSKPKPWRANSSTEAAIAERHEQPGERRNELLDQLQRLQDLYVLGDFTKAQYIMRRQALEEELQRQGPPTKPASDRARALLDEFPRFWDLETDPVERRKLLLSLFEQIWAQNGRIVAVQPHDDFLPYFQTKHTSAPGGAEGGSDGTRTRDLCRDRAAL
jgi:hypothetical protein